MLDRARFECAELLYETIKNLQAGQASSRSQSEIHPLGFYCSKRREGDELLSWDQPSRDVFSFVRAICRPGPEFLGDVEIMVNRVELVPEAPIFKGIPGAVLGVSTAGFLVKTADSFVRVVEWRGVERVRVGDRLK